AAADVPASLRGRRWKRLGSRRFHAGRDRPSLARGSEHGPGHDRSQPGADVGKGNGYRFRGTDLVDPCADAGGRRMKWLRRKKTNRRVNTDASRFQWNRNLGLAAVALGSMTIAVAASLYLRDIEWERFRALEITGELERVSPQEVRNVLRPYIASGFAGIDMHAAHESLEDLPWIARARVRREWPGTLAVELREERPVATWFGTALMNANGE